MLNLFNDGKIEIYIAGDHDGGWRDSSDGTATGQ
jgi:hypothetical protein